ncbi:hypothetical protein ABE501_05475 [Comamonas testosteroni]
MKSDDPNRPQLFLGNVENVAGRDINFFGNMSEWTGVPAEALFRYRAQEFAAYQRSKKKRWANGPFICMVVLLLALSGIAANMVFRIYGLLQGGMTTLISAAPSTVEFIIAMVVFLSLQIAQAMYVKIRRRENERAALAAKNIRDIDIELRRLGYSWNG